MTMSARLDSYLAEHHIPYQTVSHHHSNSSIGTAISANIPAQKIAKAVMLQDHQGRYLMAVLPANYKVSLSKLNDELNASYHLAKENEVYNIFRDCEPGAVPPVGEAYHMNLVCDELLDAQSEIYIESGDHETLLRLDKRDFEQLMANGRHLRFSREVFH